MDRINPADYSPLDAIAAADRLAKRIATARRAALVPELLAMLERCEVELNHAEPDSLRWHVASDARALIAKAKGVAK